MKYLGIDYGTKKIGLAVSDALGNIAFPKKIITSDSATISQLVILIAGESIEKIVIGKSTDLDGSDNVLQQKIERFAKALQTETGLDIDMEDERMSSTAARSHLYGKGNIANEQWSGKQNKKRREAVDAGAAAIILQRYLDKQET